MKRKRGQSNYATEQAWQLFFCLCALALLLIVGFSAAEQMQPPSPDKCTICMMQMER